jgi:hypothetical protein
VLPVIGIASTLILLAHLEPLVLLLGGFMIVLAAVVALLWEERWRGAA